MAHDQPVFLYPEISAAAISVTQVGSRVTCSPPPVGTDCDWLVLLPPDSIGAFDEIAQSSGWELGGSAIPDEVNTLGPDAKFASYTQGEDNLIVTMSPVFHARFLLATAVAKRLNLLDKDARIVLFQAILYGTAPTPPTPDVDEPLSDEELFAALTA